MLTCVWTGSSVCREGLSCRQRRAIRCSRCAMHSSHSVQQYRNFAMLQSREGLPHVASLKESDLASFGGLDSKSWCFVQVIYEDEDMACIVKPQGMPTQVHSNAFLLMPLCSSLCVVYGSIMGDVEDVLVRCKELAMCQYIHMQASEVCL